MLVLSMHDDERYVFEALKAGASGYVLKREADQDLVDAVRAIGRGEPFLTNAATKTLVRELARRPGHAGPREPLSVREHGGPEADRRGAHEPRDRRDPAPQREDGRVAPRQHPAQARHARPRRARALRDPPRPRRAVGALAAGGLGAARPRAYPERPCRIRARAWP